MPFLLQAPTLSVATPCGWATNSVGDPPKSESPIAWLMGTIHESISFSVDPLSTLIDSACGIWVLPTELPVATVTFPSGSTPTLLHTLPPTTFDGRESQYARRLPVPWLISRIPARTSGRSQLDAMPM